LPLIPERGKCGFLVPRRTGKEYSPGLRYTLWQLVIWISQMKRSKRTSMEFE
jgi:hypothetical protein